MFTPYSPAALGAWCVAIKHGHGAGLPLARVFETLARSGPRPLRAAAGDIQEALKRGSSFDDAVKRFVPGAPPVFLAMAVVADRTGHVPEVFGELETYFREQEKLERQFRAQAAWPVIQFVSAIVVLTLVVIVLGFIGPQAEAIFGGGPKRMVFAMLTIGALAAAGFGVFKYLKSSAERQAKLGAFLLRVPSLGGCLSALAMSRFCLALKLTTDSTIPVGQAVKLSLQATGFEAFASQSKRIAKMITDGADLSTAIGSNPMFPNEFLGYLSIAEASGQIPEVMARQAEHYREEASRRFTRLTKQMNFGLAVLVGLCLIAAIFMVFGAYVNALNTNLDG
ncbi:type II secretion system F family protein [Zavarzinella formosa]|uniref:type II secretion system F family protein n=1 Tax=Zavarzinella formosa TaxID=360055 RepID=UPI00030E4AE9|nr:type II secretion system F family protein [Zavarzinella formosa]